jgi:hypothetical protein
MSATPPTETETPMTTTTTTTRYIIALCPATPLYALSTTVPPTAVLRTYPSTRAAATSDKSEALVFDTFDAAMEVCRDITGWGGAQRVEGIAVEVPAPPTLESQETWDEIRDLATATFHAECEGAMPPNCDETMRAIIRTDAATAAGRAVRELGFLVFLETRSRASSFATLSIADADGRMLDLHWDPMTDGFEYATFGGDDAAS